jgi:hypothetical protein
VASRWVTLLSLGIGLTLVFATANSALGHSGGTDANGCHAGSQPYHCHGSRSAPAPRAPSGGLTLCADGTWSQSTGSGTCSWHGGIAGNNNPPTSSGSGSGGGGTGSIAPGAGPSSTVGTRVPSSRGTTQSALSQAVSSFFDNGGVVYLLLAWWVIAKVRKSRRQDTPKASIARSATTRSSPVANGPHTTSVAPARPVSNNGLSKPPSTPSSSVGTCNCGGREVVRKNRKTGQRFYGCSRYPGCRRTRPMR